jgi:hypothetical protein
VFNELHGLIAKTIGIVEALRTAADAEKPDLSIESRFDLAGNAAHALSPDCGDSVTGRRTAPSLSSKTHDTLTNLGRTQ